MTIWSDWGFRENPYSTRAIPPSDEGVRLLVGREKESRNLYRVITSSDNHPVIEGDNGVGKTSLVHVTAYVAMIGRRRQNTTQMLVPLPDVFQLRPTDDLAKFRKDVYYAVARGFIEYEHELREAGMTIPDVDAVRRWLMSPLFRGGGVTAASFGAQKETAPNDAAGFTEDGFIATVDEWLRECFPSRTAGGFICLLDNLELMETSQAARALLETMRDGVLVAPGLIWVLCGARGIVRSAAASPRLSGVLADPIELEPIRNADVPLVVGKRLDEYAMTDQPFVPVDEHGFNYVYQVLNGNLRDALKQCESFALWLDQAEKDLPGDPVERYDVLTAWLQEQAGRYELAAKTIRARAWSVFDQLVERGGSCSPGDYEDFGFASLAAMRPHVKDLEEANLVTSTQDDRDRRRKTVFVSSTGWLVNYKRSGFALRSMAQITGVSGDADDDAVAVAEGEPESS